MVRAVLAFISLLFILPPTVIAEPYPLDQWARRAAISNIQISPDGQYLGLMKIPAKGANPIIEIYSTDDLSAEPFRVNAKPMEITAFDWVSNDNLLRFSISWRRHLCNILLIVVFQGRQCRRSLSRVDDTRTRC